MQNLKDRITADLTLAMKAREELKLSTLRMLKAEIMKYEVSGPGKVATDEVVVDLIKKSIKQRREAAEGFEKGGNQASAQKEHDEIKLLEAYMPEQMSEEAIKAVAEKVIADLSAGPGDFGKVIGAVMAQVKGKADGNQVSAVIKALLG